MRAAPAYQRNALSELRALWIQALRPLAVALIPIWMMFELVAPEVFTILFPNFVHAVPVFRIFLFAIVIHLIIDHSILRATGDTRYLVFANAVGFLVSVIALFALTRWDLLLGAVWAYVIGLLTIRILGLAKVVHRLELQLSEALPWKTIAAATLAVGAAVVPAYVAMEAFEAVWLRLIVGAGLFGGLYCGMVWRFRLIPRDQLRAFVKMVTKREEPETAPPVEAG